MYVVDWLHKHAQHRPDKIALVDVDSGRQISYRQFDERASRFAEYLADTLALAPGSRVAVLADNSSDYLEMLYGCAKAGMVMVCLNWRLAPAELKPILDDCTPQVLVAGDGFPSRGRRAGTRTRAARGAASGRRRGRRCAGGLDRIRGGAGRGVRAHRRDALPRRARGLASAGIPPAPPAGRRA
ncbi:hypothetical protein OJJOAM_000024 [Cupriavidus sp. H18C1]